MNLLNSAKNLTEMLSMLLCTKPHICTTAVRTSSDGSSRSPRNLSRIGVFVLEDINRVRNISDVYIFVFLFVRINGGRQICG